MAFWLMRQFSIEKIVTRLISSFSIVYFVCIFVDKVDFNKPEYLRGLRYGVFALTILGVFILQTIVFSFIKFQKADRFFFFGSVILLFSYLLYEYSSIYLYIFLVLLFALAVKFYLFDDDFNPEIPKGLSKGFIIGLAIFFIVFVGGLSVLRHVIYKSNCFDFGIFAQMYHNMKTTGLPDTTCERYMQLSHFKVHISPIYYLLLPIYYIFPFAETLLIAQAVLIISGLIPLVLLCRHYKLSNTVTVLVSACYTFYPAFMGGAFFDFHENKFLPPLILFLMYFIEKNKLWGIITFSLLTLAVKEDAPMYVAFIALYMIIEKKKYISGTVIFAASVAYFAFAVYYLQNFGDGAMTDRYDNYVIEGSGIVGLIKAAVTNPAFLLAEAFTEDKLVFMIQMLAPLAFIPFITRKFSLYILLGPFLIMNLLAGYWPQSSISHQYVYGSGCLLFYIFIVSLSHYKPKTRTSVAVICAVSSLILFSGTKAVKVNYIFEYAENKETNAVIDECLDIIPEDASITASGYLVPHLYKRENIYQFAYTPEFLEKLYKDGEDFVIDDKSLIGGSPDQEFIEAKDKYLDTEYTVLLLNTNIGRRCFLILEESGYETVFYRQDIIVLLKNPYYSVNN